MENPIFVIEIMGNIPPYDYFFEEVTGQLQGIQFSGFLLLAVHLEGRLNIQPAVPFIYNKIDFLLDIASVSPVNHNAYIHIVSPADQIIVDNVFHNMTGIVLPVIQAGSAQANVCVVILVGVVKIELAFYIIPLGHTQQECVHRMGNIGRNQLRVDLLVAHAADGICNIGRVGQRANL